MDREIKSKEFRRRIKEFSFIKKESFGEFLYKKLPQNNLTKNAKITKCRSLRFSFKTNRDFYNYDLNLPKDPKQTKIYNFYWIPVECFYSPTRVYQTLSKYKNINLEVACKYPQFFCEPTQFIFGNSQWTKKNKIVYSLLVQGDHDHFFEKDLRRLLDYLNGYECDKPEFPGYVISAKRAKIKFKNVKDSLFK